MGMESCVGTEYIPFKTPVALEGKVEEYMNLIIRKMRDELRLLLSDATKAYPTKPRHEWLFDWSSQMILVVNQIFWCQETEEAFGKMSSDPKALAKYNEFQIAQITKLVEVTRTELKKEDRQKVMNMITIDAHSRDIVGGIVERGEDKVDCFSWVSQLRSYWEQDIQDCRIRICDASFPYGYEYLGNGPRLVITPLTDRIYITATQACWLSLGTAPAGPAGTGKTETTKDLASQLGKAVYVFNCAPEMDYRTMGDVRSMDRPAYSEPRVSGRTDAYSPLLISCRSSRASRDAFFDGDCLARGRRSPGPWRSGASTGLRGGVRWPSRGLIRAPPAALQVSPPRDPGAASTSSTDWSPRCCPCALSSTSASPTPSAARPPCPDVAWSTSMPRESSTRPLRSGPSLPQMESRCPSRRWARPALHAMLSLRARVRGD